MPYLNPGFVDPVAEDFTVGEWVTRWVWTGSSGGGSYDVSDLQELKVLKVSPKTLLVRTKGRLGSTFRIPFHKIDGRVDWEVQYDDFDEQAAESSDAPDKG